LSGLGRCSIELATYFNTEIDMPMNAVAPMAMKFSAVGGGAESECAQQCAAGASQTVADRGEADDPCLDNDLILVVGVTSQDDSTVTAQVLTHDIDPFERERRRICADGVARLVI
jgi:hypothetical protein